MRGWRYMLLLVRFQSTLPTRGSDHEFLEQSDAEWVSIHAPHEGERRLSSLRVASYLSCFNPRSPRGGATLISGASSSQTMVSIHAPHEGERPVDINDLAARISFQSTLPTRGSDGRQPLVLAIIIDVSIHAPHEGERQFRPRRPSFFQKVSIHAPHEGERRFRQIARKHQITVSIHAPHEGERHTQSLHASSAIMFQSTLPTRGSDGGKVHLYAAFPRIY